MYCKSLWIKASAKCINVTAFLTWQNCLISPAVSPWIQMWAIYSRQWRIGHCWKSRIKQNIRWTHIHVGRGMNAYLLFVKCFSMLAHLFHQPWTFPLITHHATCWERYHQHVLFSWNRINETPYLQCSSLRKMDTKIQHFGLNYIDGPMSQKQIFFSVSVCHTTVSQFVFHSSLVKTVLSALGLPRLLKSFQDGGQHMFSIWPCTVACQRKHLVGQYFIGRSFSVVFTHSMIPFSSHKYLISNNCVLCTL